nr:hypothetical protein [Tanacetum cinerariifolium]
MATTLDQQVALDEALVPSAQRLRIGRSNFCLPSDIQSKEPTLQAEFWATAKLHQHFIRFKMDTKKHVLDLEAFREMLHISPRIPGQPFAELPFEEEILEFLRDDVLFSTIKVVSRHQTTQQYGVILPIELTNDDIRNNKAYKEYYACATGEAAPKPKASARKKTGGFASSTTLPTPIATPTPTTTVVAAPRLSAAAKGKQPARAITPTEPTYVERTKAEQLKFVLKRSRQETHISQQHGSGTDEGTGSRPGVPDVPSDDSEEELSWNSSDDEDLDEQTKESDEGDDEATESDRESEDEETREQEEESFDPIPRTPEDDEDDDNNEEDQGLRIGEEERMQEEEDEEELYRDVDINQGRGLQVSQETEDSHVILTPTQSDAQQEKYVNAQLEAEVLTRSSHYSRTSYAVAPDLSEMELKKILIDKMEGNNEDERMMIRKDPPLDQTRGLKDEEKEGSMHQLALHLNQLPGPRRPPTPDRDWNKSVQLLKEIINRLGVDTLTPELLAGPTYELMRGSCNSLTELEYHLEEVYKATTDQLDWVNPEGQQYPHNLLQPLPLIPDNRGRSVFPFEHFINNDLEYVWGGDSSRKYTTSITKIKATDYGHFYGFAINRESSLDVYSKRRIITVTELKIMEWHNYKHLDWISVRRDDDKIYKFKEGDLKRLRIQDIEDILLLLV